MDEKILARIRGLLAKAESTSFPAEAEALTAKVADLVAKYGVDQALLADAGKTRDEIGRRDLVVDKPYALDKCMLLVEIANALRCEHIRTARKGRPMIMTLIGFESDMERVELLYTSLLVQAARQLTRIQPPAGSGVSTIAYRKSWSTGFSSAVGQRLQEAERRAATEAATEASPGTSTELVLIDRTRQVQQEFARLFPSTRTTFRRVGPSGYDAGQAAGRRADLGNGRVGGRKAAIRR
jgi:Protein of unknown function (DUF2786)